MKVQRLYCPTCGFEDFDIEVSYARQTATDEYYHCPECSAETCHVDVKDE
ncbi:MULTISPECIES: hypothetical protein [Vibrio]|nr:hypothetical protein [Vibrio sp. OPT46]MBE8572723.1 hypothetical protein [Vibrio sp. OPT46]